MRSADHRSGYLAGFAAAVTFGASAPFAQRLATQYDAQLLAGLLYLGAFAALAVGVRRRGRVREAKLRLADAPLLAGLIASGGVVAPVLLMLGLRRLDAVPASLLLSLEGPCTLVIGLTLFREHLGRHACFGSALVFLGAAALATAPGDFGRIDAVGALLVAGACAAWGIDNNLTQRLTLRDPFVIVLVKVGFAALVNVPFALARGAVLPRATLLVAALLIGAVSYGLSILLDAYALRLIGAARESVIFALAPIAGVAIAIVGFGESLRARDVLAALVMGAGSALLLRSVHAHEHSHDPIEHDHRHVHDEHHQHDHGAGINPVAPHSHAHRHDHLVHSHEHVSDAHHRHAHAGSWRSRRR